MDRLTKRAVVATLIKAGRRDLAVSFVVTAAPGIQIHDVDYSSGQEPDDLDDEFATTMTAEFTLTEPLLSKLLGVQSRVLDRRLEELKKNRLKMNVVNRLFDSKVGDEVLKALRPKIVGRLVDHFERDVRVSPRDVAWDVDSDWQSFKVERNGIRFDVEVEVLGRLP